jgi:hypothetical protein
MSRSPLRRIVAWVGGVLIAVGFACGTGAEQKAAVPSPPTGVAYTDHVTITMSGACTPKAPCTLAVDPPIAVRPPKGDLTWKIDGQPPASSIEIDFDVAKGVKGPFPKKANAPDNPARGRYISQATGSSKITSATASEPAETYWKYTVSLRDGSGADIAAPLDPIVIFK